MKKVLAMLLVLVLAFGLIACGGGAVTKDYNYAPLHQNGVIIYLERKLAKLAKDGRPISQRTSLETLYNARKASYERFADIRIESTEIKEKTAEMMLKRLSERI